MIPIWSTVVRGVSLAFMLWLVSASGCYPPGNCTVTDNGDGTATITCPDWTSVTISNGQKGPGGPPALVVTERVDVGDTNCPEGGYILYSGIDENEDGELQEGEIYSLVYVCNGLDESPSGILRGSYVINNEHDVRMIDGVSRITGDLEVYGKGLLELVLPHLQSVGGNLEIHDNDDLTKISLENLSMVEGFVTIDSNPVLDSMFIPRLESVGDNLRIIDNPAVEELRLGELTEVAGNLRLVNNHSLVLVDMGVLTSVGGILELFDNDRITNFVLPLLQTVSRLDIRRNPSLHDVDMMALEHVEDNLEVLFNNSLVAVDMPVLSSVGGKLCITDNIAFSSISMPALQTLGEMSVYSNSILRELTMNKLAYIEKSMIIENNKSLATISLPALEEVPKYIEINRNNKLSEVRLDVLRFAEVVHVSYNPSLQSLSLPALRSLGPSTINVELEIIENNSLTGIFCDSLTTVNGGIVISNNLNLNGFSFSSLRSCLELQMSGNVSLCRSLVDSLIDQLRANGWTGDPIVDGNDDTC